VRQGDLIGYSGCTGACLKPHLHFQVRAGGGPAAPTIDPAPFLQIRPSQIGDQVPLEGSG
jgi:murein DD-endopeptidase MepM/ murein hydrolase activator NlpD